MQLEEFEKFIDTHFDKILKKFNTDTVTLGQILLYDQEVSHCLDLKFTVEPSAIEGEENSPLARVKTRAIDFLYYNPCHNLHDAHNQLEEMVKRINLNNSTAEYYLKEERNA